MGAVLKDYSLIFWDNSDHFTYEKLITTASHTQDSQTSIHFLEHFNTWITCDKSGRIYSWDIKN